MQSPSTDKVPDEYQKSKKNYSIPPTPLSPTQRLKGITGEGFRLCVWEGGNCTSGTCLRY